MLLFLSIAFATLDVAFSIGGHLRIGRKVVHVIMGEVLGSLGRLLASIEATLTGPWAYHTLTEAHLAVISYFTLFGLAKSFRADIAVLYTCTTAGVSGMVAALAAVASLSTMLSAVVGFLGLFLTFLVPAPFTLPGL